MCHLMASVWYGMCGHSPQTITEVSSSDFFYVYVTLWGETMPLSQWILEYRGFFFFSLFVVIFENTLCYLQIDFIIHS